MTEYIPACDIHTNEDFEFTGEIIDIDEETRDILYSIAENIRCETCFLRELCIASVIELLQKEYDLPRERFELEGGPKVVCN